MTPNHNVETRFEVKIPMRDGVNLSADIYLPQGDGPFPTTLTRTAFGKSDEERIEKGSAFAAMGYACVIQDFRGRYDSEGIAVPFHYEGNDGYDTQEWIGQQSQRAGLLLVCQLRCPLSTVGVRLMIQPI